MDALLSPLIVYVAGPLLTWTLLRALERARALGSEQSVDAIRARTPLLLLEMPMVALVYMAALHAIGPELVEERSQFPAQAGALGAGVLTIAAAIAASRPTWMANAADDARHLLLGGGLLLALGAIVARGPWPELAVIGAALTVSMLTFGISSWRQDRRAQHGQPKAVGVVLACTLAIAAWAGAATLLTLSAIADEEVSECSAEHARFRMRISPWDANARLALAWNARRSGHLDQAESRAVQAVRLGGEAATTLDFFAELAAAHGDCTESYARFESALRIRAAEAFTGVLERPLQLGESALPPTYIRDCLRSPSGLGED